MVRSRQTDVSGFVSRQAEKASLGKVQTDCGPHGTEALLPVSCAAEVGPARTRTAKIGISHGMGNVIVTSRTRKYESKLSLRRLGEIVLLKSNSRVCKMTSPL